MKKDGSSEHARADELRALRAVLARSLIALVLWFALVVWLLLPVQGGW
ncbi:hypothetical protein [Derxia lacustris]|nr:hypothetical protein [Derxia lacustris]